MRTENEISQDLQKATDIKNAYQSAYETASKIRDIDNVETDRPLNALSRGIKRMTLRQKRLNEELDELLGKGRNK